MKTMIVEDALAFVDDAGLLNHLCSPWEQTALTLANEVRRLQAERDEAVSAVQRLSAGEPFNAVVITDAIKRCTSEFAIQIEQVRKERDVLLDVLEDAQDIASKALRKAWQLGQVYWQQADSESWSENRKSDQTQAKFQTLVDDTRAAIANAKGEKE